MDIVNQLEDVSLNADIITEDYVIDSVISSATKKLVTSKGIFDAIQTALPKNVSQLSNDTGYITLKDVTLPTNISYFNNDVGYVTEKEILSAKDIIDKSITIVKKSIPVSISQLVNDKNYVTDTTLNVATLELDTKILKEHRELYHVSSDIIHTIHTVENSLCSNVPHYTSQLYNDSKFITQAEVQIKIDDSIPQKISYFANDAL